VRGRRGAPAPTASLTCPSACGTAVIFVSQARDKIIGMAVEQEIAAERRISIVPTWSRRILLSAFVLSCACAQPFIVLAAPASSEPRASPPPRVGHSTFDNLPQRPISDGNFLRWCGVSGRFLMSKRTEHGGVSPPWIQGTAGEAPIPLPNPKGLFECDQAGDNLIITRDGTITTLGIVDHAVNNLVAYKGGISSIAVSPDRKYVAFDDGLVQIEKIEAPDMKRLAVGRSSQYRIAHSLLWNADSSFLLNVVVVKPGAKLHQEAFQLIEVRTGREINGNLPAGAWFESAVILANRNEMLLFLRPSTNDIKPDPGSVYACDIISFKSCRVLADDVDQVSFSADGKISTVKEVLKDPKRRLDGDAIVLPIAFVVEVRDADGKVIASQRFTRRKEQMGLRVLMSPTGNEAALISEDWSEATQQFGESGRIVALDGRR
jgi:hypothetical protein